MENPLTHIILTPIPVGIRGWDWRGAPVSDGPPECGATTGAIAIGATATSTLTTTTILIGTISLTGQGAAGIDPEDQVESVDPADRADLVDPEE
jgi:hypothetical protein